MNNIEPGDLVEYIKITYQMACDIVKVGGVYRVAKVEMGDADDFCGTVPCVVLENIHPYKSGIYRIIGQRSSDFRKIHPDSLKKATKTWDWTKEPVKV